MNRRVSGLTEFTFHQQLAPEQDDSDNQQSKAPKSRLFRTIGISGWINDKSDFQRPWGVQPTDPPIQDKVELLQRFYSVHNPDLVPAAEAIWKRHREQPGKLWHLLETKYGCNPDHVFAKENSDNYKNKDEASSLTEKEIKRLDQIIVAIGKVEGGEKCDPDQPKEAQNETERDAGDVSSSNKQDKRQSIFRG